MPSCPECPVEEWVEFRFRINLRHIKSQYSHDPSQSVNKFEQTGRKMVENTKKGLKPALIGVTVLILIAEVDRGRGDHKNLK